MTLNKPPETPANCSEYPLIENPEATGGLLDLSVYARARAASSAPEHTRDAQRAIEREVNEKKAQLWVAHLRTKAVPEFRIEAFLARAQAGKWTAARKILQKTICGAHKHGGGQCLCAPLKNGRCKFHGGMSTGATTQAGRERIAAAQRERWRKWREARGGKVFSEVT